MPRLKPEGLGNSASWLVLLLWAAGAWGGQVAGPLEKDPSDQGVFLLLSGDEKLGTEKFQIASTASGYEATGEITLTAPGRPQVSESSSLRLNRNLQPKSYDRRQKSPQEGSVTAQFGSPESMLVSKTKAGTQDRIFFLPDKDLVVLDTNFFHHYAFLVNQYDSSRPGPQHFNVFIPQEAMPGTISLALQGTENPPPGGTAPALNHYQAVTDQLTIEIWATPEGKLQRISIPQVNLEVVRQESD